MSIALRDLASGASRKQIVWAVRALNEYLAGGGVILFPDGTVLLPGGAFADEPSSGVYWIGTGNWAASVLGVKVLELLNTAGDVQVFVPAGTAARPGIASSGDPDTGLRWITGNELGTYANGLLVASAKWDTGTGICFGVGISPTLGLHVSKSQASSFVAALIQTASTSGALGTLVQTAGTDANDQAFAVRVNAGTEAFAVWSDGKITGKNSQRLAKTPLVGVASATLTLTTSATNVTGASVTLSEGNWLIYGMFDWQVSGAGDVGVANTFRGTLTLGSGGTNNSSGVIAIMNPMIDNMRLSTMVVWSVTVSSGNTPTAQLQAKKDAGTGASVVYTDRTHITAVYAGNPV